MSGFLAIIGRRSSHRLEPALARLAYLGGDEEQVWSEEDTLVAVTRKAWELDEDFSGPILVLETPDLVVAADASIYDRGGLTRAFRGAGVAPGGSTPSHLIEAAYRAWGPALVDHLIGDYSFVVWDRRRRRLVAARDPHGLRSLFYGRAGEAIAVGSSSRALAELLGRENDLNLACLGVQAAGLAWSLGTETSFKGVDHVPPGHRLVRDNDRVVLERFWHPRAAPSRNGMDRADAAEELRSLLCTAVAERLGSGTNTVWMSGGYDSTAVFGAGQHVLPPAERSRLRPVSISYPPRDVGCEDDFIKQVATHWGAEVHWLQSEDIPLLDDLEERAARTDEPPAHLYELWNRALARGTRSCDARVTFDGSGGDQLFQVSDVVLADLLRTGHWIQFARHARSRLIYGRRHVVQASVLPLLPESFLRVSERVFGRRIRHHYLERPLAEWVRPDFARHHGLRERDLSVLRAARQERAAHSETLFYLLAPTSGHAASYMRGALLQEGVENRSPLMDPRIVEFALSRPASDRADHTGIKLLLRQSMEGLLPTRVLAHRPFKTGLTLGYSRRRMKEAYPALVARLSSEPLRLGELGIVDPVVLRTAADRCCAGGGDEWLRVNLFNVMKVEFWLRGLQRKDADTRTTAGAGQGLAVTPAA
jgi:asparagine synthase (glutamine-hydrolysing)